MIDIDLIVFWVFAAITIISAYKVIVAGEIVHSLIYLAFVFLSIAVIYFLLSAEFVALVQILIYVGAVLVVLLFGIMLTKREIKQSDSGVINPGEVDDAK